MIVGIQDTLDVNSGEASHTKGLILTLAVFFALCSGMVSDKRVLPTKDNSWVNLARKPMIADNKELEKVFKPHKQICLLNLPPAEKTTTHRSKIGSFGMLHTAGVRLVIYYL